MRPIDATATAALVLVILTALIAASCGGDGDAKDSSRGDKAGNAENLMPPAEYGDEGRPTFAAVRNGSGWRLRVSFRAEGRVRAAIASVSVSDGNGRSFGRHEFEGDPRPVEPLTATFDVPADAGPIVALASDRSGRTWEAHWSLE